MATLTASVALDVRAQVVNCRALPDPGHYPYYGPAPQYSIARRAYSPTNPPTLELRIAISPKAFAGGSMVRLGCKLAADFSREKNIHALIFDNVDAARNLSLGDANQPPHRKYLWHLKARYALNRDRKNHFIEVVLPQVKDGLLTLERIKYWLSSGE